MVRPLLGCKSPSPGLCGPPQATAFALQVIPTRAEPRHQGGLHPQSPKISFGTTSCLRVNFWGDPSALCQGLHHPCHVLFTWVYTDWWQCLWQQEIHFPKQPAWVRRAQ